MQNSSLLSALEGNCNQHNERNGNLRTRLSFPSKMVTELYVQWKGSRGYGGSSGQGHSTCKEPGVGGNVVWSRPSRKHGHYRELKGSWSWTSDQGSDDGKPLAWLRIFQDFLLCNAPPPPNLPILDELILFKVNCLRI